MLYESFDNNNNNIPAYFSKIILNIFKPYCMCIINKISDTYINRSYTTLTIFSLSITSAQMFSCENPVAIINWVDKKAPRVASRTPNGTQS